MKICEELAAGFMTGFLISLEHGTTKTDPQNNGISANSQPSADQFIVLFGPVSPDTGRKLRPYLTATPEVGVTRPTIDDQRVQKRALALIAMALECVDREGPFTDALTEYREG